MAVMRIFKGPVLALALVLSAFSARATVTYDGTNGVRANIFTSNSVSACTGCHYDGAPDTVARFLTYSEATVYDSTASSYVNSGYMPYNLADLTTNEKNLIAQWVADGSLENASPTVTADVEGDLTISKTTATISGTIDPNGAQPSVYTFRWGSSSGSLTNSVNSNNAQESAVGSGGGGGESGFNSVSSVSTNISSLTCGTTYYFTLSATNSAGTNTTSERSFTTNACNSGPTIDTTSLSDATEQILYQTTIAATDPEGDDIDFALTANPTGMTINSDTGLISWTPSESQSGSSHTVTVTATDTTADINGTDSETFSINAIEVNDAPSIDSTAVTSATEDVEYSYQLVVSDDDDSSFSYQLLQSPSGMSVDGSGEITWTPTNGVSTSGTVIVEVSDDDATNEQTDTQSFTVSVTAVNDPPVISSTAVTSATEDSAYSYDVDATDEEGVSPVYSLTTNPSGMSIDSNSGLIGWTPSQSQIGGNSVVVSVTDGNTAVTQSFTVTVSSNNDTPSIDSSAVTSATESVLYQYDVDATDEESDTLTYSLTTKPSGMTIDSDSGEISWTPSEASANYSESVVVSVTDSNTSTTQSFTITVSADNDSPVIDSTAVTVATESSAYSYTVSANDNENDTLTYSLTTNSSGMTIDADTGAISWTPEENTSDYSESVVVSVSDGNSADTQTFSITVSADDDAPVFTSTAVTTATESSAYSYTAIADDGETNSLTYALVSGPSGMTVGSSSGVVSWTPDEASSNYSEAVEISVSDASTSVSQSFTITVSADNDTPAFTSSAVTSAVESTAYSYDVDASDNENDTLSFSLTTKPDGMIINSSSGLIAWTPPDADSQYSESVVVAVSDGNTSATQSFTLTVTADVDAPFFTSSAITTAQESLAYSYLVVADDNQDDTLTFSLITFPSGMTIGSSSGQISWTPPEAKVDYSESVTVSVTDGSFSANQSFSIAVTADDDAPVITSTAITVGQENLAYQYDVNAIDNENDSIGYSITTDPSNADISIDTNGVIDWTPAASLVAYTQDIRVQASDGNSSSSQSFTVNVVVINDAPSITSTAGASATEDMEYQYQVGVDDPDDNNDGTALSFSLLNAPTGMTITTTGLISWTPIEGQGSASNIQVTVADGGEDGASAATQIFSVTVSAVNDAPLVTSTAVDTAQESVAYSYQVTATDAENDTLTFSIDNGPVGMTIDANSGAIDWTPAEASSEYTENVAIDISDGQTTTQHGFSITVSADNDAPVLTSSAVLSATEDVSYSYTLTAADNENDNLSFSLTSGPTGMVVTGNELSWTPSQATSDYTQDVIVAVSDGLLSGSQSFTITVSADDDAPVFDAIATQTATESTSFLLDVNATDPESQTLTFSLDTGIGDMAINSSSGVLTWTPREEAADYSESVTVSASDGTNSQSTSFTINISADNDAPTVTSAPITSIFETTQYQYDVDAIDNENQTLTFSLATFPSGMIIDPNSGVIDWLPPDADSDYDETVTVNITDGTNTTPHTFTVSVVADADTPLITSGAVIMAEEDVSYSYQVTADDLQDDTLTFSLTVAPAGMSIHAGSGLISWTPPQAKSEYQEAVTVNVSDGSFSSQQSFTITVDADDDRPSFITSAVTQIQENQTYSYDVDADDSEGDEVSFALTDSPSGMTIDANTGEINWQAPAALQAYTESVTVQVSDGNSGNSQSFEIQVSTVNDAPSITSVAPTTGTEDVLYQYLLAVTDPDDDNDGVDISFGLSNAPMGMSINSNGLIEWTPVEGQSLASNIMVTAQDGGEDGAAAATETFSITVTAVNDAPEITSNAVTTASESQTYSYQLVVNDVDDDSFTYSLTTAPDGMTIDGNTGLIEWTPSDADESYSEQVVVLVSDGESSDSQSFAISVSADADAPVITSNAVTSAEESSLYQYQVVASDPQDDELSFELQNAPDGMSIDPSSGLISWTPPEAKQGFTESIVLTVSDGSASAQQTFTLIIDADDDGPVITGSATDSVGENQSYSYAVAASDPESDTLAFSLELAPDGMIIDAATGAIDWTAAPSAVNYQASVRVAVSDGRTSTTQSFTIDVIVGNEAPVITSSPTLTATEDALYSYQIEVADPDDENNGVDLTFELTTSPTGMSVNETGLMEWTPVEGQIGEFAVVLSVADGGENGVEAVTQGFSIEVISVNDAPVITSSPGAMAIQYEPYEYQLVVEDPDDLTDQLSFELVTGPTGMTLSDAGLVSWTPELEALDENEVEISVADGGEDDAEAAIQTYTLVLSSVNISPAIISDPVTTATEDEAYSYRVTVEDPDDENNGSDLTFTLSNAPEGMTISSIGLIDWTPTEGMTSAQDIRVSVADGGESGSQAATQTFGIAVNAVNDGPEIVSEPPLSAVEAQEWQYQLGIDDLDDENNGVDISISVISDLGEALQLDDAGLLSWTPGEGELTSGDISITVRDGGEDGAAAATQTFNLIVTAVNQGPELSAVTALTATEDEAYEYQLIVTDPDDQNDGESLVFSLDNAPDGMTVSSTGEIGWTPVNGVTGSGIVMVNVIDGGEDEAQPGSVEFEIAVTAVNDAPTFTSEAPLSGTEDEIYLYEISVEDIDNEADELTLSLLQGPEGMALESGELVWTPFEGEVTADIVLQVNDGELETLQSFTVEITPVNDAPQFDSEPEALATEDELYSYHIVTTDPDSEALSLTLLSGPSGMRLDDKTLSWTPQQGDDTESVILRLSDGIESVLQSFEIVVTPVNDAPVLMPIAEQQLEELQTLTLQVVVTDVDSSEFSFSLENAPDGMTIDANGRISWLASEFSQGEYAIAVVVDDGSTVNNLGTSEFQLRVTLLDSDSDTFADYVDNCPEQNNLEQTDFDQDGLGDSCDTDDDNDGLTDDIELQVGLNPEDAVDALLDLDGDGLNNLDEFLLCQSLQDSDCSTFNLDNVAPEITMLEPVVTVDATSYFTQVNLAATAFDTLDGDVTVSLDYLGPYRPGHHRLVWTARDRENNIATAPQILNVRPLVEIAPSKVVGESQSVEVVVKLNGPAPNYPIEIQYGVSGSADESDMTLADGVLEIASGTQASLTFDVLADAIVEADETIILSLNSVLGDAVLSSNPQRRQQSITIVERNIAPELELVVTQGEIQSNSVYQDQGAVTVFARVFDANNDTLSISWEPSLELPEQLIAESELSFEPAGLDTSHVDINVIVSDGQAQISNRIRLFVLPALPVLSAATDSDNDGISDAEEGVTDSDKDKVPDYLDAIDDPALLAPDPNAEQSSLLSTEQGLSLALGDLAAASQTGGAQLSVDDIVNNDGEQVGDDDFSIVGGVFDFEVSGLNEVTRQAQVVIPLPQAIPANAVYRKFNGEVWLDFVIDGDNAIASSGRVDGLCPAADSELYQAGLTPFDTCVRLTLSDGGPNDADGEVNGVIKDPGGVAIAAAELSVSFEQEQLQKPTEQPEGGGSSRMAWLLAMLALLVIRRRLLGIKTRYVDSE